MGVKLLEGRKRTVGAGPRCKWLLRIWRSLPRSGPAPRLLPYAASHFLLRHELSRPLQDLPEWHLCRVLEGRGRVARLRTLHVERADCHRGGTKRRTNARMKTSSGMRQFQCRVPVLMSKKACRLETQPLVGRVAASQQEGPLGSRAQTVQYRGFGGRISRDTGSYAI